jgi:hypothetical protein
MTLYKYARRDIKSTMTDSTQPIVSNKLRDDTGVEIYRKKTKTEKIVDFLYKSLGYIETDSLLWLSYVSVVTIKVTIQYNTNKDH